MAWNWVRRCFAPSSPKAARKPRSLWLRCEPLEDRVVPDANTLLDTLSFRLYSPQTLGATIAPYDPSLAAVWSGQSLAPGFGANSPYSITDASDGNSTPAGGHFLAPGEQAALPNGELLAPDTISAAGLGELASPDGPWPTPGYVYQGASWPQMADPSSSVAGPIWGPGSWYQTWSETNSDGSTTTYVLSGSSTGSITVTYGMDARGNFAEITTQTGTKQWYNSTITTSSGGSAISSQIDYGTADFTDVQTTELALYHFPKFMALFKRK